MSSVLVQQVLDVAYLETPGFPAGSAVASITATITGAAAGNTTPVTVAVNVGAPSITVPLVPDTYTYTIENLDAAGNQYAGPFGGTFTVVAPVTVSLNLATGLSVPAT